MPGIASLIVSALLWLLGALVVAVTLLPFWDTNRWWVRAMDFPRVQIAATAIILTAIALFTFGGAARVVFVLTLLACTAWHVWRVLPYTVIASQEMRLAKDDGTAIHLMSSNVLMENTEYDRVARALLQENPDVVLLMETDQAWVDALEPVLAGYPTVLRQPQDNHYGMVFATRLPVDQARIIFLTQSDTPSILAQLRDAQGRPFRFVGLHPRPPVPGEDTEERDAQILYAARFAASSGIPVVTMGDFNDVAWSPTSKQFKHVGRYLDPRIGRGFFASFDASRWWLRLPIDQLYVTPDVAVVGIGRLGPVGSDHFPMSATVRLDSDLAATLNNTPPEVTEAEAERVADSLAKTRDKLGHGDFSGKVLPPLP